MVANIYLGKRTTSEIHDDNENQNGIKLPLNSPKKLKLCTGKYCEEIKLHRLDYIIILSKFISEATTISTGHHHPRDGRSFAMHKYAHVQQRRHEPARLSVGSTIHLKTYGRETTLLMGVLQIEQTKLDLDHHAHSRRIIISLPATTSLVFTQNIALLTMYIHMYIEKSHFVGMRNEIAQEENNKLFICLEN